MKNTPKNIEKQLGLWLERITKPQAELGKHRIEGATVDGVVHIHKTCGETSNGYVPHGLNKRIITRSIIYCTRHT